MKASYTKPLLAMEMFSLNQMAVRDCADSIPKSQVDFTDPSRCVWNLGGGTTVFIAGSTCVLDGEAMGIACYNNPSEGHYIFRS